LLATSPQNRETLTSIEDALFVINLDDYSTGTDIDKCIRNMLHGLNARNRWFDKAMSISIESSGRTSMNGEVNIKKLRLILFFLIFYLFNPSFFVSIHLAMLLYLQLLSIGFLLNQLR
jgi:hypothetical protein